MPARSDPDHRGCGGTHPHSVRLRSRRGTYACHGDIEVLVILVAVAQSRLPFAFHQFCFGFAIGSLNAQSVADQMSWTWIAATATSTDLATDLATDASHCALAHWFPNASHWCMPHAGNYYFSFVCMFLLTQLRHCAHWCPIILSQMVVG